MISWSFYFNKRVISIWFYMLIFVIAYTGLKYYCSSYASTNWNYRHPSRNTISIENVININLTNNNKHYGYKYILVWPNNTMFKLLENEDKSFVRNKCKHKNCYVSHNKDLLHDIKDYDAVVVNGFDVILLNKNEMLKERSPKQKYIFASYKSAIDVPMCFRHFDGFFNLTWSYKIDSDIVASPIKIYDLDGKAVGPRIDMKWINTMDPIKKKLKLKLSKKNRAAAWFGERCTTSSKREDIVRNLRVQLARFDLAVDIYGKCGRTRKCPGDRVQQCSNWIAKKYHFYLAFEDTLASDYVTEELSRALNNYTVPIVFGGADYNRFVPEGAYLDASEFGETELAYKMNELINNRTAYHDFFRWRNHYTYDSNQVGPNKDVCQLCEMLNNADQMSRETVRDKFRLWWNEGNFDCRYHEVF